MNIQTFAIKLAASAVFAGCWTTATLADPTLLSGPKFLVHGNYCGLGNNAPLAPVDALDAACSRHDACTPDDDLPLKECNLRLEREAQAIALDMSQSEKVRMMAGLVATYASTAPSRIVPITMPVSVRPTAPRPAFTRLR
ncbi:hypothetical protein [Methylobacterium nonmethylotrophicum]|uniref:hypothetical protein n=1 Tax=Methylobacterium nonmethylotrophicum TaxID=1141884 RepID=UPI00197C94B7|nr:hypothetical protein [Methylobacterium nonmethylotrophicum]